MVDSTTKRSCITETHQEQVKIVSRSAKIANCPRYDDKKFDARELTVLREFFVLWAYCAGIWMIAKVWRSAHPRAYALTPGRRSLRPQPVPITARTAGAQHRSSRTPHWGGLAAGECASDRSRTPFGTPVWLALQEAGCPHSVVPPLDTRSESSGVFTI
jgi:hypothetical protein